MLRRLTRKRGPRQPTLPEYSHTTLRQASRCQPPQAPTCTCRHDLMLACTVLYCGPYPTPNSPQAHRPACRARGPRSPSPGRRGLFPGHAGPSPAAHNWGRRPRRPARCLSPASGVGRVQRGRGWVILMERARGGLWQGCLYVHDAQGSIFDGVFSSNSRFSKPHIKGGGP